jgi:mannosyltransferase OCH1-like enzyme
MKHSVLLSGIMLCILVQGGYLSARRRISSKKSAAACAEYMMIEDRLAKGQVSSQEYRNGRAQSKHTTELRSFSQQTDDFVIEHAHAQISEFSDEHNRSYFLEQMSRGVFFPKKPVFDPEQTLFYAAAVDIFAKNAFLLHKPDIRIPKKIHQIWIGSEPPAEVLRLAHTLKKHNPDFEYKLWRDADLASFGLDTSPLFWAAPNWGERADIFRYCILHKHGGIYCDMDIVCYQSFEPLIHGIDFFAGIPDGNYFEIANGVIGCVPGHPIMRRILERIISAQSADGIALGTVERTGPLLFTRVITECWDEGIAQDLLIFPLNYFYHSTQGNSTAYAYHYGHGWWSKPERIRKLSQTHKQ